MKPSGLLSPRAGGRGYDDVGERPALMVRQRVRRTAASQEGRLRRSARAALGRLAVALAIGATGLALHFALTSEIFAVATVDVQGASRISPAAIIDGSGIARGTNLFLLDERAVARRLERIAEIQRAEVIRAWPNRVTIVVEERRPFTLVHAGRLHWIDEEGVPLGLARQAVAPSAPVISGLTPEELEVMRERPSPRAQMAITLIRTLLRNASPLSEQISEIDVGRRDGPVLYTVDGVEVRLGTENWEGRLRRLEGVLARLAASPEPVTSIDLRFRDQVVLNGGPPQ